MSRQSVLDLKNSKARCYLQMPASLPVGISHFLETHTTSRLHGAPAAWGGLQTGGVKANMHTSPFLQSLSSLH
ncbi:hypothetical protein BN873_980076 [Candidatus Competibacter denitrificans Run_A_D11]|uniref:Uncharacterized protein n=1 Tax=Candidatus Competibacter denitrificans Run_A_D11 TaxID=1400863 RepID=W6MCZ1_9GAMM|nr:hypothetical protein BN873_980076 [Candidatus Competibacter denitrificans Run_A_D11]